MPRRRVKMARLCSTCRGEMKNVYEMLIRNLNRGDRFGDMVVDQRAMD
jgi:hypothetical protein